MLKDAFDTTFEVSKLIKYLPRCDGILEKLKAEMASDTTGFRVLCRTRWTIRASSLKSVLDNYVVLQELWEVSQGCTSDPAYKGRIIGVEAQDKKLQSQTFSAAEGELMARMTSLPSRLKATLHYKAQ